MATQVLMVATCNGLRLADSRTRPEFNFGFSFVDGPGLAYVSSIFSSSGGDIASVAFLAAMATGCMLGEAVTLINALVYHAKLERTSYLALGDVEHRSKHYAERRAPLVIDTLPAYVDFGDSHFAELLITQKDAVEAARGSNLTLSLAPESQGDAIIGFHRLEERSGDCGPALVSFAFRFPQSLGKVLIEATDPEAVRTQVHATLDGLAGWVDLWQLVGLDLAAPETFDDLRKGTQEARLMLGRSLTLIDLDGGMVARIKRQTEVAGELVSAAIAGVLEHLAPQLQGSFWLSNLHTAEHRFERSEQTPCPHCQLSALRRTMRHALTGTARVILVCPRCGICSDISERSPIETVMIEAPNLIAVGEEFAVTVVARLARDATLSVDLRLSTHGEEASPPYPDGVSFVAAEAGMIRLPFVFHIPPTLSPHRHYMKVLLATAEDLAFASRPFFVCTGND
ncbi:MAG TPA: hypothetical protein VF762_23010 [Blastocatellia bacterium]